MIVNPSQTEEREIMQVEESESSREKSDLELFFSQMIETIQSDSTISEIKREEVLQDLEVVQLHLEKDKANASLLSWLLSGLEEVPAIAASIKEFRVQIGLALRHHP